MKKWTCRTDVDEETYRRFQKIAAERYMDVSKMLRKYIVETIKCANNDKQSQ